jgi:hypothetical protein
MAVFSMPDILADTRLSVLRSRTCAGKTGRPEHQTVQALLLMSPERQARRTEYLFSMIPKHLSHLITFKGVQFYIDTSRVSSYVGTKQSNPFHPPGSFRNKAQEGAPA